MSPGSSSSTVVCNQLLNIYLVFTARAIFICDCDFCKPRNPERSKKIGRVSNYWSLLEHFRGSHLPPSTSHFLLQNLYEAVSLSHANLPT